MLLIHADTAMLPATAASTAAREAQQRADASAAALAELTQKLRVPAAVERSEIDSIGNRLDAIERGQKTLELATGKSLHDLRS